MKQRHLRHLPFTVGNDIATIPTQFGMLKQLKRIDLSKFWKIDFLFFEFWHAGRQRIEFSSIEFFCSIALNRVTAIPTEIGSLTNLEVLEVGE